MEEYLIERAGEMGLSMSSEQAHKFRLYHELLLASNKDMNLTRISEDEREACDRNYLDSLTTLKYMGGARTFLDVGSGAGFPGIPISIMKSDVRVTLMETLT